MDLQTALRVFSVLEAHRYDDSAEDGMAGYEPIFDVRLDATTDRDDNRQYRIRVTTGAIPTVAAETWLMVLDAAKDAQGRGFTVAVQNDGMEIRA